MKQYFKYLLSLVIGVILPFVAKAHIKWFVDVEDIRATNQSVEFFTWFSKPVWVWIVIAVGLIGLAKFFNRKLPEPQGLLEFGKKHQVIIYRGFKFLIGLFLVSISGFWHIILIPQISVSGSVEQILQIWQGIVGLMLMFNVWPKMASLMLAGLYFLTGWFGGLEFYLENVILLAIVIFIFLQELQSEQRFYLYKSWAMPILRIGTGVSLIVLAFTEKFLHPELSLNFLQQHNWNFIQLAGWNFSNELFVLSAGFMETIFGLIFILGYIVRINTIVMSGFFATSVTTMALQSGVWEVEDLVIYAVAIMFIFFHSLNMAKSKKSELTSSER